MPFTEMENTGETVCFRHAGISFFSTENFKLSILKYFRGSQEVANIVPQISLKS